MSILCVEQCRYVHDIIIILFVQKYGRWDSTVYLTYVEAADADRREWEEIREPHEQDQIRENFDIFGHLCK